MINLILKTLIVLSFSLLAGLQNILAQTQTISSEALQELPTSSLWTSMVNFRPGDREDVTLNPPRFSWTYNTEPVTDREPGFNSWDISPKEFILQIAYSEAQLLSARSLSDPLSAAMVINIRTKSNSYNFLAPFNPPLLNGKKTVYWQVGYIKPKEPLPGQPIHQYWTLKKMDYESTPFFWSSVRSFSINSSAQTWDRSMFSDDSAINTSRPGFLAAKSAHPHIFFNNNPSPSNPSKSSRQALFEGLQQMEDGFLHATSPINELYAYGRGWYLAKRRAADIIESSESSWWPETKPCPDTSYCGNWGGEIATVAFVYQMVKDRPEIKNYKHPEQSLGDSIRSALPQKALVRLAQFYIADQGPAVDQIGDQEHVIIRSAVAFGYDWLYDLLDNTQKAQVLKALELTCQYAIKGGLIYNQGREGTYDPTGAYPGPFFTVRGGSLFFHSAPHPIDIFHSDMIPALAAYGDRPICDGSDPSCPTAAPACREFFDLGVNYMFGVTYPWGYGGDINSGRTYYLNTNIYPLLDAHLAFQMSLPEGNFNKNPFWAVNSEWVSRLFPPNFFENHGAWGILSGNAFRTTGEPLSYLSGNGKLFKQWREELKNIFSDQPAPIFTLPIPFYFKPTMSAEEPVSSQASYFKQNGWVIGCSNPSNLRSCYDNGVGFAFQARPSGDDGTYAYASDLSFELWAYGSTLTDAGGAGVTSWYGQSHLSHYSLLVNGQGPAMDSNNPESSYFGRIYAYKNQEASGSVPYVYAAADGTKAFPHEKYQFMGQNFDGVPFLNKAHRHFLFVRKKYFVIFDDLESQIPVKYSSLYHILEDRLTFDPTRTAFTYISNMKKRVAANPASILTPDVNVYVKHISSPSGLELLDRQGADIFINPFTNQDFLSSREVSDPYRTTHNLIYSNQIPSEKWNFMQVIYPQQPGTAAPLIERIDDFTAKITNSDGVVDIISFNSDTAVANNATLIVDVKNMIPSVVPEGGYPPKVSNTGPVVINIQPRNQIAVVGERAAFWTQASGSTPITYQWQRNGINIAGATTSSYTTVTLASADSGANYRCVIRNGVGTASTTNTVTLTVNPATTAPSAPVGLRLSH